MTSINRTPLLSICVSLQHYDPPPPKKKSLFLDCSNIPPLLFFHSPSDELNQESLFRLKVGHGCTLEIQGNERTSFTKWWWWWGGGYIVSVSSPWFQIHPPSVGLRMVLLLCATMPLSISEVLMENKICLRM